MLDIAFGMLVFLGVIIFMAHKLAAVLKEDYIMETIQETRDLMKIHGCAYSRALELYRHTDIDDCEVNDAIMARKEVFEEKL